VLLFALIFRGISMEFRGKRDSAAWRRFWDYAFFAASAVATLLFGVAVGNGMIGIELNARHVYAGSFFDLLRPYPLLVGLFTVAMFAMHGSIYLYLKTEGQLQERIRGWMWSTFGIFLVLYMLTTIYTLTQVPRATQHFQHIPWAWIVVVLSVLAIANIPRAIYLERPGYAFLSSCATIAAFIFLFSLALYPNLVTSTDPAYDLTIYDAASSQKTLTIMLIIAIIGMPFVLAYTGVVYWVFRGKVQIGQHSY
jgi:cytochrome bd ubiquinol oxidase subunit II